MSDGAHCSPCVCFPLPCATVALSATRLPPAMLARPIVGSAGGALAEIDAPRTPRESPRRALWAAGASVTAPQAVAACCACGSADVLLGLGPASAPARHRCALREPRGGLSFSCSGGGCAAMTCSHRRKPEGAVTATKGGLQPPQVKGAAFSTCTSRALVHAPEKAGLIGRHEAAELCRTERAGLAPCRGRCGLRPVATCRARASALALHTEDSPACGCSASSQACSPATPPSRI
mmetsp:Transcript_27787/g.88452  ORF Transcript_27787/g.88452 Transcript_27787/m.88452 type:complete len:235 (-) Transcript_27787:390-1094(-)